jgi:hypothetical protein
MDDVARLIGCTRQSISAWEKPERSARPSRRDVGAAGDRDLRTFISGQPCGCHADPTAATDHHYVSTV